MKKPAYGIKLFFKISCHNVFLRHCVKLKATHPLKTTYSISQPFIFALYVQNKKAELEKESQQSSQKRETEEEVKKERTSEREVEVEEGDEDERLLQEFEDEMADLSVPSSKIEEIKEEMQKEFDNIIEEV